MGCKFVIKTIIFDLNRVLVAFKDINQDYQRTFGITQKKFWKPMKEFFNDYATGKTNWDYVLTNILIKNKLDNNRLLEAKKLYEKNLSQMPGINVLLKSLNKNYSLILAAGDGKESLEIKLKKLDLAQYFNKIYATCYIGLMKTDENFYNFIFYKSNLASKETLFIDDKKQHLDTAKKLSINTVLFENLPKLKKDLKEEFNISF